MFYLAVTLAGVILISPGTFQTLEECETAWAKLKPLSQTPVSLPASQPLPSPCVWVEPACGKKQKQKCRGRAD
jgi:hypothetical protein